MTTISRSRTHEHGALRALARPLARLLAILAISLVALPGTPSARAATAPPGPVVTWSDLRTDTSRVRPLVASQYPGDASGDIVDEVDDALAFQGRLARGHGSEWAVAGVDIPASALATRDLSAMRVLALDLSADRDLVLRVRIKGPDARKQRLGCYPALEVRAGRTPRQWVLPLEEFRVERYCERGGVPVPATLEQLSSVEITAFETDDRPWRFRVERVQFAASDTALASAMAAEQPEEPAPTPRRPSVTISEPIVVSEPATQPVVEPVVGAAPAPAAVQEAPRPAPTIATALAPTPASAPARVAVARPAIAPRPAASAPLPAPRPKVTCVRREDWQLALCY